LASLQLHLNQDLDSGSQAPPADPCSLSLRIWIGTGTEILVPSYLGTQSGRKAIVGGDPYLWIRSGRRAIAGQGGRRGIAGPACPCPCNKNHDILELNDHHNVCTFQKRTYRYQAGLRIRIHLIRIRHFRLNTDPDPIRIQGFYDQKSKENFSCKKIKIFFGIKNRKTTIYISLGLHKEV
jgi:hypothetical protein